MPVLGYLPCATVPSLRVGIDAFLAAHDAAAAWPHGTNERFRDTLDRLAGHLGAGATLLTLLDTPHGSACLRTAFVAEFGGVPDRPARLTVLRTAVTWWRARHWLDHDPTRMWARQLSALDAPAQVRTGAARSGPALAAGAAVEAFAEAL